MKLKIDRQHIVVILSRRNLKTLLAKLDGFPKQSFCSIESDGLLVHAEPDDIHYAGREPGPMHPATEHRLKGEEQ